MSAPRDRISTAIRQAVAQGHPAVVGFMTAGFPDKAGFRASSSVRSPRRRTWSRSASRSPIRWPTAGPPGQPIVPGGIGGMGWGPPAAATAKLVHPGKRVTCLVGDGGFMMTMPVLTTCVQNDLPIVVVVANNSGLGMVRDNLKASPIAVDYADIDFARIAEGLGCKGLRVDAPGHRDDALAEAHRSGVPCVIDVTVDPESSHVQVSHY